MKKLILCCAATLCLSQAHANCMVDIYIDGSVADPCKNPSATGYGEIDEYLEHGVTFQGVVYDDWYSLTCKSPGGKECKWNIYNPPGDISPVYAQTTVLSNVCGGVPSGQIFADGSHGNGNYYSIPAPGSPSYFAWSTDGQGNIHIAVYESQS